MPEGEKDTPKGPPKPEFMEPVTELVAVLIITTLLALRFVI